MSRKIFGTDGVRGLANQYPMNPETALALGRAIAHVFKGRGGKRHRIVIGKDTRRSGYMIENALSAGICSMGGEAIFLGPLPTPGIAFITQAMRADAGVVISASHNPYYDNGIKFFDYQGYKLPDELEAEMERLISSDELNDGPTKENVGKAYRVEDAPGRYIEFLKSTFPKHYNLEGLKLVVDCANGASYHIAPVVFEELGAEVISLGVNPNGLNINQDCGALHPEALQAKVKEEGADLGIALDGDADRLVLADEKGEIVHGDALLGICAKHLQEQGQLARSTVVITTMSNLGLELYLRQKDIQCLRVKVGDRYIIGALRHEGYSFGGEQSGHLIFGNYSKTGDGILAALQVLAILRQKEKPLSELVQGIHLLPQILINVEVQEKKEIDSVPELQKLYRQVTQELNNEGRVMLRYSGTENLLRIMLEGEDAARLQDFGNQLKQTAEQTLGNLPLPPGEGAQRAGEGSRN